MVGGERCDEGQAFGVRRVVDRRAEEPIPVPAPRGDVVESVTGIGDDPVDVDHGKGALLSHRPTVPRLVPSRTEVLCPPVTGARRPR